MTVLDLPPWAERTPSGLVRCKVCGHTADRPRDIDHDCIYANDLVADGGRETRVGHWLKDDCDVYAGRGKGGRDLLSVETPGARGWLGNPHTVEDHGRGGAIVRFRKAFEHRLEIDPEFRDAVEALHGKVLGCWCQRLYQVEPLCHAGVIAEWADRLADESDTTPEVVTDGGRIQPEHDTGLFDARDRETFRLAVETWGSDAQTDMAVEELGEAIQELASAIVTLQHLKRDRADWNDVHEELADIRIMYEQLRWFFGPGFVDERVQAKMDRLRERLADAGMEVPDQ